MTNAELLAFVKKNPISVGCGLLALALTATIYLRAEAIPEAEEVLAQKTVTAERYALNIKYSAQLKDQLESLVGANKEIDARILRATQLGTNTQYFYKLQSDTGVKLLDFRQGTAGAPAKGKSFVAIPFSVSVQGTLPQVMNFLRELESGAHYCRILTASCAGNAGARSLPLTLTINLEMLGLP